MEPEDVQSYIDEYVEEDDYITMETPSNEVSGTVTSVNPLVVEPVSGVVLKYELAPSGELIEVYWDDSPDASEAATRERTIGLVRDVSIDDT